MMMAWKVSGLSHRPAIIVSRPASMRLAMAISPSRDSSSTEPISRRYMRTGIVGAVGRLFLGWWSAATAVPVCSASSLASPRRLSGVVGLGLFAASSSSTTLMPMSESIAMVSSICSEVTSSDGSTEFSSSMVT